MSFASRVADAFGRVNTPMSPGIRRLLNAALYALALILPLVWAFENISFYNVPETSSIRSRTRTRTWPPGSA